MFPPPQPMQEQMPPPQAPQEGQEEASHTDCVPLFYYINSDLRDHFYSTNFKELEGARLHASFSWLRITLAMRLGQISQFDACFVSVSGPLQAGSSTTPSSV